MYKWGLISSPACTFCERSDENMLHLFINCEIVTKLWDNIKNFLDMFTDTQLTINYENVLLNAIHPQPTHVCNLLCLVTKQYIYRKRCKKELLNAQELIVEMCSIENIEKYIAQRNGHLVKHKNKWCRKAL